MDAAGPMILPCLPSEVGGGGGGRGGGGGGGGEGGVCCGSSYNVND